MPEISAVLSPAGTSSTASRCRSSGKYTICLKSTISMPISSSYVAIASWAAYGRIERLARRVIAGPGMIAADDEIGASVIAPDDRVQQDLARAGHAHGQRQQAEHDGARLVVVVDECPIAADARVVVDVSRLGHSHDWVDQEPATDLRGGSLGELFMARCNGLRV